MKKVDIKKLKERRNSLGKGGGDTLFFANKIKTDSHGVDIRIVEPLDNMPDDMFFLERRVFWMEGKNYVCPSTFGEDSPILDEIEQIKTELEEENTKESLDILDEVKAILDSREYRESSEHWMVAIIFDFEYEGSEVVGIWADNLYEDEAFEIRNKLRREFERKPESKIGVEGMIEKVFGKDEIKIDGTLGIEEPVIIEKLENIIIGKKLKIFSCGVTMMQSIIDELSEREMENGKPLMGLDQHAGLNINCKKTGEKWNEIEYKARHFKNPMEMPDKYYKDSEKPDIVKMTRNNIESDDYLRQVVRNFLLGEEMPDEKDSVKNKKTERKPKRPDRTKKEEKSVRKRRERVEDKADKNDGQQEEPDDKNSSKRETVRNRRRERENKKGEAEIGKEKDTKKTEDKDVETDIQKDLEDLNNME